MPRIILASQSPRRRELLAALVEDFEVLPSRIDEPLTGDPDADALRLATDKAREVAAGSPGAIVIGADTVVHDGQRAYEKPADRADAIAMWHALRGRAHRVLTGVAVIANGQLHAGVSTARVTLSALSDEAIERYADSGRPMDKAGGYAIQDEDVPTVARLDGCYCCVVGLPLWRLAGLLREAGIEPREPSATFARCAACPERPGASHPPDASA
ncbi:MAG: Maf family protein [Hyphomicrobiales bacterium]